MKSDEIERLFNAEIERIKAEPPQPAGQPMFGQACSFHLAGIRALEPKQNKDGTTQALLPPAVANLAFACELYLKALLAADMSTAKGHDLQKLFNQLSNRHHYGLRNKYGSNLSADIAKFSHAFVDWRYVFEKVDVRISIGDLHKLVGCLHAYVSDAHPEWSVHPAVKEEIKKPPTETILLTLYIGQGRAVRVIYKPPVKPTVRVTFGLPR